MSTLTKLSPMLHLREHEGRRTYLVWCPACQCCHPFDCWPGAGRPDGPGWTFDGNVELPTFSPSLRIFYARDGNMITTCHFVIERGVIKYCGDYQSEFAGRQVQMEPIPEDYGT